MFQQTKKGKIDGKLDKLLTKAGMDTFGVKAVTALEKEYT